MTDRVQIRTLPTGISGLDALLHGGLPEFSFVLIAGEPGSGKTTLAHQMMFAMAGADRPALYFTVLGEPPLKMLRYQQQFGFFDQAKVKESIHFLSLADEVATGDYGVILERITAEVERHRPGLVFVDSFRSVIQATAADGGHSAEPGRALQEFVQQLGMLLTSWQATTFLIGEYSGMEAESHPIFTVADGVLWLSQNIERNSMVRKIQVMKMRGTESLAGLHTFKISADGIHVYPRALKTHELAGGAVESGAKLDERLSTGVTGLDDMLGGGIPVGYSLLVAGPSGSGKTVLTTAFLAEGARRGERGVVAAFEKSPSKSRNHILDDLVRTGMVGVIDTRALDLSIDETLHSLTTMVEEMGATRVVIDSLAGFELALAPTFREDFRESLYRMVTTLTSMGMTVVMTSELEDRYTDLRFSPYGSAFLTDAIIVQRYIELRGRLERVMAVVKVRNSAHDTSLRRFSISGEGIAVGDVIDDQDGLLTGRPSAS